MSEDNNMYPVTHFPPQLYFSTANAESPLFVRGTETTQRKRPKYTRSKTGCMTCRVKKVKCDETKPVCARCTHGSRECSWPEGILTRRRTFSKRDSVDEWPSTSESVAESPGLSESPPSSGREQTPPYSSLVDLVPVSPRSSDLYETTYSMSPDHHTRSIYQHQHSHSFPMTSASHYTTRYDHIYPDSQTVACGLPSTSIRQQPLPQVNPTYWNVESDTYNFNHRVSPQENIFAGQPSSPHDYPHRFYQ